MPQKRKNFNKIITINKNDTTKTLTHHVELYFTAEVQNVTGLLGIIFVTFTLYYSKS